MKVRVKNRESINTDIREYVFTTEMSKMCGNIIEVEKDGNYYGMPRENKGTYWYFHPSWVEVIEETKTPAEFTDTHYNMYYELTEEDIKAGKIKVDTYFVNSIWKLGEHDGNSGILFHILKTLQRYGRKNSKAREREAIIKQAENLKRFE